jgi:hypothetical protein
MLKSGGWAFELKYDSRPRLDFKGVVCIGITDTPVAQLAYKIDHPQGRIGLELANASTSNPSSFGKSKNFDFA